MVSGCRRCPRFPPKPNYYFLAHIQCSLKFACKLIPCRVVHGLHFEARTQPELEITNPNPARSRHLFLKPVLGPKAELTEWVKKSTTAEYQKRSVRVYCERYISNTTHSRVSKQDERCKNFFDSWSQIWVSPNTPRQGGQAENNSLHALGYFSLHTLLLRLIQQSSKHATLDWLVDLWP